MADLLGTIRALIEPVSNRIKAAIARGVVDMVDDQHQAQELTIRVLSGEVLSGVENLAGISGITSYPPEDSAEHVTVFVGGMRDHPIVIATNHRSSRPAGIMSEGDVIVYHPIAGSRIHLRADGTIEILASGGVSIAGDLDVMGSLTVSGDATVDGDVADGVRAMSGDRTLFNVHLHKENGAGGGTTDPPTPQQ